MKSFAVAFTWLAIEAASAIPSLAQSTMPNGRTLFNACLSARESTDFTICSMYISGFINGANWQAMGRMSGALCMPPNLTGAEAISAFVRIGRTLQGEELDRIMNADIQIAVGTVLGIAYPCQNQLR